MVTRWNATSSSGFVLAARSLREVEIRESQLGEILLLGWLAFMVGILVAVFLRELIEKRSKR